MNIAKKLDELADLQAALDLHAIEKQKLIDSILTPEIKQQLADIDAEFSTQVDGIREKIGDLEAEIKAAVIAGGASVKGAHLQAVYAKGRVTWDGAKLEGMMAIIPGLASARKEGQASVSLRSLRKVG